MQRLPLRPRQESATPCFYVISVEFKQKVIGSLDNKKVNVVGRRRGGRRWPRSNPKNKGALVPAAKSRCWRPGRCDAEERQKKYVVAEGERSSQVKLILSPKQRAKPAASRTRTCTNAAVCIASGECPSRF